MGPRWLADAVSLQHFGSIGRISLLCEFLTIGGPPYWTMAVRSEVLAGMIVSEACREVLACADLQAPHEVPDNLLTAVIKAQVALGGGGASGDSTSVRRSPS